MQVLYRCCCGLDVHKQLLVACLSTVDAAGERRKETRRFTTMTQDILALAEWLASAGCTHVAMESTGVYWRPIWNLLEGQFDVLLVNAQHIKAVPGRKTDIKDAEWIAELLQHGLLRPSFVPPRPQRQLRELTRYRTTLLAERARVVNRLQKVLEDTNLKLSAVATNILGLSARAMLTALLEGETDPQVLARLARGKLRAKRAQLEAALVGQIQEQHRFVLTSQLAHIAFLEEQIAQCDTTIEQFIAPTASAPTAGNERPMPLAVDTDSSDQAQPRVPTRAAPAIPAPAPPLTQTPDPSPSPPTPLSFQQAVQLLDTLPGVNQRIAQIIVAEIGVEMDRFPSAAHLASWVGLCPGNHQSAGKQLRGTTRKGDRWLRQALIEAAQGAMRTKGSYLRAQGERLTRRRGKKRAVVAVAHTIVIMAYHMLLRRQPYQDLGSTYFDERERAAIARQSVRRLEHLGFQVTLQAAGEVA
jgi:transposase